MCVVHSTVCCSSVLCMYAVVLGISEGFTSQMVTHTHILLYYALNSPTNAIHSMGHVG